jgi:hypothetical protein
MNEILTYCPACDKTHGPDCPADPFGPEETITVADLAAGDFVIALPAHAGVRGFRANSAVREISAPAFGRWKARKAGYGRRALPVQSRQISFLDRDLASLNVPLDHPVIVRRRAAR